MDGLRIVGVVSGILAKKIDTFEVDTSSFLSFAGDSFGMEVFLEHLQCG